MSRTTIDFGIDLGTTNSSIAEYKFGKAENYRNNDGLQYTPSAVWINKHDHLIVGRSAYQRLQDDPDNACGEFKRLMGTKQVKTFSRSGRKMTPEELSAEVLKSLRADVKQQTGEDITAAVITTPADFELPQNQATQKAAKLAGFETVHLLQEPSAAAIAYGSLSQSDKVIWMVYDFGGGTFDISIVQVREGIMQILNHGGNNTLGGREIDWAVVDNLLTPALLKALKLDNFRRGNPNWQSAFAKLKWHAEQAKIELSKPNREYTDIDIDFNLGDNFPEPFKFEFELTRSAVAAIAEPFIDKTIKICRETLSEKNLGSKDIEKMILVGGPTLAPYVREMLKDETAGLGIPFDMQVDPMLVVAQGAAISAGEIIIPPDKDHIKNELKKGKFVISFPDWECSGQTDEPLAAGTIESPDESIVKDYTIEFSNATWQSGRIPLDGNSFVIPLKADKNQVNFFKVRLFDKTGTLLKVVTNPEELRYSYSRIDHNIVQPLTHSLGLALASGEFYILLEKGTPLPAHKRVIDLKTVVDLRKDHPDDLIRIPVMEGEKLRANRNRGISILRITPENIKIDVPAGSDVEVTINIDSSRLVTTSAYIPILDEEFEDVISMDPENIDENKLKDELKAQKERLKKCYEDVKDIPDQSNSTALNEIENNVQSVETALASGDPAAAKAAQNDLLKLANDLDEIEDQLDWPKAVRDAEGLLDAGDAIAQENFGNSEDRRRWKSSKQELKDAINSESRDLDLIRQCYGNHLEAVLNIVGPESRKAIIIAQFNNLSNQKGQMSNPSVAEQLISQGQRAINANNIDQLASVNQQLAELLPGNNDHSISHNPLGDLNKG